MLARYCTLCEAEGGQGGVRGATGITTLVWNSFRSAGWPERSPPTETTDSPTVHFLVCGEGRAGEGEGSGGGTEGRKGKIAEGETKTAHSDSAFSF